MSGLLRGVLRWLPAALAAVLLVLLWQRGWRPAVAEERRLDACELDVSARQDELFEERATLARDEARVEDPIWHERVRRSLLGASGPLLLESSGLESLDPATASHDEPVHAAGDAR